jgi:chorismate--pyruvate lyase
MMSWLQYKQSLTERLKKLSGEARLDVLGQGWGKPDAWDIERLGLETGLVFHREIVMSSSKQPCWYARTVIPDSTYGVDPHFFGRLKQESVGGLIFNEPRVERVLFINYSAHPDALEYQWLKAAGLGGSELVGLRLSGFTLDKAFSFFLIEILLPGLLRYAE